MIVEQLLKDKREEILTVAAKYGAGNVRVFGPVSRGFRHVKRFRHFL